MHHQADEVYYLTIILFSLAYSSGSSKDVQPKSDSYSTLSTVLSNSFVLNNVAFPGSDPEVWGNGGGIFAGGSKFLVVLFCFLILAYVFHGRRKSD